MLLFDARPTAGRQRFEQKVRGHVEAIEKLGAAGPDYATIHAYVKANEAWKDNVKEHFSQVQGRKCGYCERFLSDWGDVEHFRPKNAVYRLREPGKERPGSSNVEGRKFWLYPEKPGTWDSGYWWLAYDWDNYLVACGVCNRTWKSALFPVRNGHQRRPRRGDEVVEEPYLLSPYGSRDPAQHLEYTAAGGIKERSGSRYGRETIEVYGLDRPSLVASRIEKASSTHRKLRQLHEAETDAEMQAVLKDIAIMGDEATVHAGMVRAIFVQTTGWSWQKLVHWLATR